MRKMDKLSEAVWFHGREDRMRQGFDKRRFDENYEKIFGKRKLPHGIPDAPEEPKKS